MTASRKCVKCGDPLGDQRFFHYSRTKQYNGASTARYMFKCRGPCTTPGGRAVTRKHTSLPVHYQNRGDYRATTCGLKPGRVAGKHKDPDAQVAWARVRADIDDTTCHECLAVLVVKLDGRLTSLLKRTAGPGHVKEALKIALARARTRITMNGVEGLVSA